MATATGLTEEQKAARKAKADENERRAFELTNQFLADGLSYEEAKEKARKQVQKENNPKSNVVSVVSVKEDENDKDSRIIGKILISPDDSVRLQLNIDSSVVINGKSVAATKLIQFAASLN